MYQMGYDEVNAYKMVYSGGVSIYSTYDAEVQRIVDDAFNNDNLFPTGQSYNVNITFETDQGIVRKSEMVENAEAADAYVMSERQYLIDS